jgi:hypothetical protein
VFGDCRERGGEEKSYQVEENPGKYKMEIAFNKHEG